MNFPSIATEPPANEERFNQNIQRFNQWKIEVDDCLDNQSRFGGDCPQPLVEAIRYSLLAPGKRIRPILVLLSAVSCDGDIRSAMPAAIAVEMFHVFTLIHDDLPLMDDDARRRGQPASHKKFGEALAVLAGSTLFAQSYEILLRQIPDPVLSRKCCLALAEIAHPTGIAGGQLDDLRLASSDHVSSEALESIFRRKTGRLMAGAAKLGGILAGADEPTQIELGQFGENLGIAFQIVDDLRDAKEKMATGSSRQEVYYGNVVDEPTALRRVDELTSTALNGLQRLDKAREEFEIFSRLALGLA